MGLPMPFLTIMRILVLSFILFLMRQLLFAVPAYPYLMPITINGGVTYIKMCGDENSKWAEDSDGYSIIQDNNNKWWYASLSSDGHLTPSSVAFTRKADMNNSALDFLRQVPKHLAPTAQPSKSVEIKKIGRATGERKILVILMEYPDKRFSKTKEEFDNLFNQENYQADGAQGSVRDYYLSASYSQLKLSSDIYGPYTASNNMGYYGNNSISGNDVNPFALFTEAIENVAHDVDLRIYDGDGDGFVDNVHIIYAGYGEEAGAEASAIWAHESSFYTPYEIQNVKIDRYSCAPELRGNSGDGITRIGPHCHEIGHALGAKDYYDTNYEENGNFFGTGQWDVMAQGSWNNQGITPADFNPYVKAYDFGWVNPTPLPKGEILIYPSNNSPENYFLLSSNDCDDYYLIENRSNDGWGKSLPGKGLLIYHIYADLTGMKNVINASAPQHCYIVCASSKSRYPNNKPDSYGAINTSGCPYPGSTNNHEFSNTSIPSAFFWGSDECNIELNNIMIIDDDIIKLSNLSEGEGIIPKTQVTIFTEGFETEPLYTIINTQEGKWENVENPHNPIGFIDRPNAHTGTHCLQLSAKNSYFSDKKCCIEIMLPEYLNISDEAVFSGYYTSYGLSGKTTNILRFGILSEQDEWEYKEIVSSVNLTWNPFVFNIPSGSQMTFRIEGEASMGTIIAIDDIEVINIVSTGIADNYNNAHRIEQLLYYSIDGKRQTGLKKGINIIKDTNGRVYKRLIK